MNKIRFALILLVLHFSNAWGMEPPEGQVILTISGAIDVNNSARGAEFDFDMIKGLPQHLITTKNPWVQEATKYKGPKLEDLLSLVKARNTQLTLTALNDYEINFDFKELARYQPIVAWSENDTIMEIRDRGPLWLILPVDNYPELKHSRFNDFMIWQLRRIEVRQ